MTDIAGKEIHVGDWITYATRSWGQHALKFARVKELNRTERPHGRFFDYGVIIENFNVIGKYYTAMIEQQYVLVISKHLVPYQLVNNLEVRKTQ